MHPSRKRRFKDHTLKPISTPKSHQGRASSSTGEDLGMAMLAALRAGVFGKCVGVAGPGQQRRSGGTGRTWIEPAKIEERHGGGNRHEGNDHPPNWVCEADGPWIAFCARTSAAFESSSACKPAGPHVPIGFVRRTRRRLNPATARHSGPMLELQNHQWNCSKQAARTARLLLPATCRLEGKSELKNSRSTLA